MKNQQRISPRLIKNFLQLAATAFALSANLPAGAAEGASRNPAQKGRAIERRGEALDERVSSARRHVFPLPSADAEYPARVDVTSASKGPVVRAVLHVPARLGPLANGAYTVAIRTPSSDEVQHVKITGTDRYLHFTVDAPAA